MSIYGSRRDRVLDNDPTWERIMLAGTGAGGDLTIAQSNPNGARLRKANPVDYLLPASVTWLRSLPRDVRPVALASKYARVVNLLAQQWNDQDACSAYFRTLLADRRGGRKGFPVDVHADIHMLQAYFFCTKQSASEGLAFVK